MSNSGIQTLFVTKWGTIPTIRTIPTIPGVTLVGAYHTRTAFPGIVVHRELLATRALTVGKTAMIYAAARATASASGQSTTPECQVFASPPSYAALVTAVRWEHLATPALTISRRTMMNAQEKETVNAIGHQITSLRQVFAKQVRIAQQEIVACKDPPVTLAHMVGA